MTKSVRSLIIALHLISGFSVHSMNHDTVLFPQHGQLRVENIGNVRICAHEDNRLIVHASIRPRTQPSHKLLWTKIEGTNLLGKIIFSKLLFYLDAERIDLSLQVPHDTRLDIETDLHNQITPVGDYHESDFSIEGTSQRMMGVIFTTPRPKL